MVLTVFHLFVTITVSSQTASVDFVDGRTYVHTDGRADGRTFEIHFIRSTQKSRPKKWKLEIPYNYFGSEFPATCNQCGVIAA